MEEINRIQRNILNTNLEDLFGDYARLEIWAFNKIN